MKGKWLAAVAFLALAALAFAACGGDDEEEADDASGDGAESGAVTVQADDFAFEPTALSGDPGQALSVNVTNKGAAEHTFTVDGLGVDEEIAAGQQKLISVRSSTAGEFEFYCRYHKTKMTGTLTIGESGAAAPTEDSDGSGSGYGY